MSKVNITKSDLEKLISQNFSHRKMAKHFSCSQSTIQYWLRFYGLKTLNKSGPRAKIVLCKECKTPVKRGCIYCSTTCKDLHKYNRYINDWLSQKENGGSSRGVRPYVRRYLYEKRGEQCEECGWNKVHPITNRPPLEIHHINGNSSDNTVSNLQILCPSCHSLTPNFRRHNKYYKNNPA